MGFERNGYYFEGAFTSPDELEATGGVYIIWCKTGDAWKVLDVGESHNVRERVSDHERQPCWVLNCQGIIYYSAHYTPHLQQHGRQQIEAELREIEKPLCGEG